MKPSLGSLNSGGLIAQPVAEGEGTMGGSRPAEGFCKLATPHRDDPIAFAVLVAWVFWDTDQPDVLVQKGLDLLCMLYVCG